jgi:AraC family transcriptional regulator
MTSQNIWTPTHDTHFGYKHLELSRGGPAAAYLPEHSHPEAQISVRFGPESSGGRPAPVEVNLYAPHQNHAASWGDGWNVVVWRFSNLLLEEASDELSLRGRFEIVPVTCGRDAVFEAIGRTLLEDFAPARCGGGLYFESMATFLAGYILRRHCDARVHRIPANQLTAAQMRRLHAFIHERMEHGFDIMELARSAGLPMQLFAYRLRLTTGLPPWAYVQRYRISMACQLLKNESVSLAEVAHRLGFSSQSHFTNAFRAQMRNSPGAYRKLL